MMTNRFSHAASLSGALYFDFDNPAAAELGSLSYWQGVFGDISDKQNPNNLLEIAKQSDKRPNFMPGVVRKIFSLKGIKRQLRS